MAENLNDHKMYSKIKSKLKRLLIRTGLMAPEIKPESKTVRINDREMTAPVSFPIKFWNNIKTYNRFLPILAEEIERNSLIIDVGANIGDTMYTLLDSCECGIVCVEPSEVYFKYLSLNTSNLNESERSRVRLEKELLGTGNYSGDLEEKSGTGKIVISENSLSKPKSLDEVCKGLDRISIVKVDTDGFDFDVLLSGKETLRKSSPIIFFENQIDHDFQKQGFLDLYRMFEELGYTEIHIFDNFGNHILSCDDFKLLESINDYVYSQAKHSCVRTFGYTDVLVGKAEDRKLMEHAVAEYKKRVILT